MKRILTVIALTIFSAAHASAETWECSFSGARVGDWLRGQVFVTISNNKVTVFDSLINQVNGAPIQARVSKNNDNRFVIDWELNKVKTDKGYAPRINYSLIYLKAKNQASFTARSLLMEDIRYPNRQGGTFSSKGTCRRK